MAERRPLVIGANGQPEELPAGDTLPGGTGGGGATNLAQGTRTATTVEVTSSTGTSATLEAATTSFAGAMTAADKTKLDGIAPGATTYADENAQDAVGAAIAAGTGDGASLTYNDSGNAINVTNTDKGSSAVAAHEAAADPHPQYTTAAEAAAAAPVQSVNGMTGHVVVSGVSGGEILVADGVSPPSMLSDDPETDFIYQG